MTDPEVTDSQTLPEGTQPAPAEAALAATTPPAATAPTSVDPEAIKTELRAEYEKREQERVAGLQRLINERDEEISRLKLESLPEEDRERLEIEQTEQYYVDIERENWLWRKSNAGPDAAEASQLLSAFVAAPDRDAQFDILLNAIRQLKGTATPAAEPQAQPGTPTPPVDRNNPAPQVQGPVTLAPDGTPIDAKFAEQFLSAMKEWPAS